jgi:hypothetical protein
MIEMMNWPARGTISLTPKSQFLVRHRPHQKPPLSFGTRVTGHVGIVTPYVDRIAIDSIARILSSGIHSGRKQDPRDYGLFMASEYLSPWHVNRRQR